MVKEAQCRIFTENSIKQDEVKQNSGQVNSVKKVYRTINLGRTFEKILYTVANLRGYTNTMEYSTDLSYDTFKDSLFHLWRKISELPELKNRMVTVEIAKMWDDHIIKEVPMTFLKLEDGRREVLIVYLGYRHIM